MKQGTATRCLFSVQSYPGLKPGATRCIAPTELDAVVQFQGLAIDLNIFKIFIYKIIGVNINAEGVLTLRFVNG